MGKKTLIIALVFVVAIGGLYYYMNDVVFPDPENCNICHFITPFYKAWKASTHNQVECLKCHEYSPIKAVAGQFMYLAGAYNPRPLTRVPDRNCLQGGCHDKRLMDSKEVYTKGEIKINFDHKPHYEEMKRGIRLHCSSCHSDIVQGSHLTVSMNVCFLCHFKGVPHDQALSGCPSCHQAPTKPIMVMGKKFSHQEALKAGYKCRQCHIQVSRGDGVVPKEKCYFCHVERTEMYDDVQLIHEKHVGEKQVDCLWCHPRIEHGKISMAKNIPML
jgi:hypothetical protein